jgi:hypothetical protein
MLQAALGGSVSVVLVGVQRAVLAGADPDAAIGNPFLEAEQKAAIAQLAELIIPRTDTAGAMDAGVPGFIELMLSDWYTAEERQPFLDGLIALDEAALVTHGSVFADCVPEQQAAMFRRHENSPFYDMARELTTLGYYTSEVGIQAELHYLPVPGVYIGDYDYADLGRQQVN